jgi:GNAT superfamily N-acetyltransferase
MKKTPRGPATRPEQHRFEYWPVTPERLHDLQTFSQCHGRFRYCSCMRWRMPSGQYRRSSKQERVAALEDRVRRKIPIGVLAYAESEPIGWCSVAPRETCEALERYRALERIDASGVWSVVCFFVDARFRRRGIRTGLVRAAIDYAKSCGGQLIEAYPAEPGAALYGYMGNRELFESVGFRDATPPARKRWIFRRRL